MKGLQKYISQIFQDTNGDFSSKRTVTIFAVLMMAVGFFVNLFTDLTVDQFIFESIMYVVIAGLGFTGAERFAPSKNKEQPQELTE